MPEVWKVEESLAAFGRNLRTARLRRGLTQSAVAAMAGVSAKTIQKLEAGDSGIALKTAGIVMLALGFGTPFGALCSPETDETGRLLDMERVPKRGRRLRRDGEEPEDADPSGEAPSEASK
ncbi:MAG: helix-turn-helix domain-containing protein [Desulfovibrio sp.]|nr:helix-turn-helix domain-containing protein [Desulfovibrio sp.]